VISNGRLIWGIARAGTAASSPANGYPSESPADRIRAMAETVEIVTGMWREPSFSYTGRYFTLDRAQCDPKPLQDRPQVLIGGGGEQLTLRAVARLADAANFGGKPHEFAAKCEVLKKHCSDLGRDYDTIAKTGRRRFTSGRPRRRSSAAAAAARSARSSTPGAAATWSARRSRSPSASSNTSGSLHRLLPWCSDYPETTTMTLFRGEGHPGGPPTGRLTQLRGKVATGVTISGRKSHHWTQPCPSVVPADFGSAAFGQGT